MLHRSQLLLSDEQYRFLADEARRARQSMSSVLRAWIEQRMQAQLDTPVERDAMWDMVGIAHGGPGRASENADSILISARLRRRPKRRKPRA
jgi:hypothetical protein